MKGRKSNATKVVVPLRSGAPIGRCPDPPAWLSNAAAREWAKTAPILFKTGQLTEDAQAMLAAYCACIAQVEEFEAIMQAEGRFVMTDAGKKIHPAYRPMQNSITSARQLASELNLTPARRGKVDVPVGDGWGELIG
jgi:P27 family predicted phage terminase small subunit